VPSSPDVAPGPVGDLLVSSAAICTTGTGYRSALATGTEDFPTRSRDDGPAGADPRYLHGRQCIGIIWTHSTLEKKPTSEVCPLHHMALIGKREAEHGEPEDQDLFRLRLTLLLSGGVSAARSRPGSGCRGRVDAVRAPARTTTDAAT
jgi:hypothetical protein